MTEALGKQTWARQQDIANAVAMSLTGQTTEHVVAAATGHGIGKSFLGGALVLWALNCFPEITVLTTAPTWRQVEEILWREVHNQHRNAALKLGGRLNKADLRINDKCFGIGLSTNDPTRFQGFHNTRVFVLIDEASGVDRLIFDAVDGVTTGEYDTVLMLGNPTDTETPFHDCFTGRRKALTFQVSSWEAASSGVTGLATAKWCDDKKQLWGEESPAYQARVMGEFPEEGSHALIKYSWVRAAERRAYSHDRTDPVIIGVDIARFGEDRTVWAVRKGDDVIAIHTARKLDVVSVFEKTMAYVREYQATTVVTDDTGLGGGLTDMLAADARQRTVGVNFAAGAYNDRDYENRRAEIWDQLKIWLQNGRGALLPDCQDRQLIMDMEGDLTAPEYSFTTRNQRMKLESKRELKKRRDNVSPDIGDALALCFATDGAAEVYGVEKEIHESFDFWDGVGSRYERKELL